MGNVDDHQNLVLESQNFLKKLNEIHSTSVECRFDYFYCAFVKLFGDDHRCSKQNMQSTSQT
jgi:hypothetical protein